MKILINYVLPVCGIILITFILAPMAAALFNAASSLWFSLGVIFLLLCAASNILLIADIIQNAKKDTQVEN